MDALRVWAFVQFAATLCESLDGRFRCWPAGMCGTSRAWKILGQLETMSQGWCPYRCDVRRAAAEMELPPAAGDASAVVEEEPPMEPVTPSSVPGPAAPMVL